MVLPHNKGVKMELGHVNWVDVAAYLGAGISSLLAFIVALTHKRIDSKADAAELILLNKSLDAKAEAAAVIALAEDVRQKANMELVTQIMTRIDAITQKAIEELGKRPTREEIVQSFERRKS
jgi:hypothetical protein